MKFRLRQFALCEQGAGQRSFHVIAKTGCTLEYQLALLAASRSPFEMPFDVRERLAEGALRFNVPAFDGKYLRAGALQ